MTVLTRCRNLILSVAVPGLWIGPLTGLAAQPAAHSAVQSAVEQPPGYVSAHQADLARHADTPTHPDHFAGGGAPLVRPGVDAPKPCRTVYGFLPYWISPSDVDWSLLTHVSCFGIELNPDGSIADRRGWPWTTTINTAKANGVKVHLSFILFNDSGISTLLGSSANKQRFFANLRTEVIAGNADGVLIDFEGTGSTGWPALMDEFMAELTAYVRAQLPGREVMIAGPAVNWSGRWNLPAVAAACDGIFIMGYDFYGSWSSTTGPSSPLTGGSINITNTVNVQYAGVDRQKMVLGVPYYGNSWRAASSAAYAATTSHLGAVTFANAQPQSVTYGRQWDTQSQTPWYRWNDGTSWRQVWYDDAQSIGLKFDLARTAGLRGVGMWALGYDGTRRELWDTITAKFVTPCAPCKADFNSDGVLDIRDFTSFQNEFARGCP